jgi:cbb3-type cytochrome c oxidase subunit III
LRRGLGAFLALAAALASAGCGTGGIARSGDANNGRTLFTQKCAGCHTLADANSQAAVGPNLDNAFYGDRKQGIKQSSIANVVLQQIRIAIPPMPANLVKGQDAQDVATYVASVAGTDQAVKAAAAAQSSSGASDAKSIFQGNCASCHTLKDANATGTVGPNLDQLKPTYDKILHQVEVGGGPMPAFKGSLSTKQIQDVAAFVFASTHA